MGFFQDFVDQSLNNLGAGSGAALANTVGKIVVEKRGENENVKQPSPVLEENPFQAAGKALAGGSFSVTKSLPVLLIFGAAAYFLIKRR